MNWESTEFEQWSGTEDQATYVEGAAPRQPEAYYRHPAAARAVLGAWSAGDLGARALIWSGSSGLAMLLATVESAAVLMLIKPHGTWGYAISAIVLYFLGLVPGVIMALGQGLAAKRVFNWLGVTGWFFCTLQGCATGLPAASLMFLYVLHSVPGQMGQVAAAASALATWGFVVGIWQAKLLKAGEIGGYLWYWLSCIVSPIFFALAGLISFSQLAAAGSLQTTNPLLITALLAGLAYGLPTVSVFLLVVARSTRPVSEM